MIVTSRIRERKGNWATPRKPYDPSEKKGSNEIGGEKKRACRSAGSCFWSDRDAWANKPALRTRKTDRTTVSGEKEEGRGKPTPPSGGGGGKQVLRPPPDRTGRHPEKKRESNNERQKEKVPSRMRGAATRGALTIVLVLD